MTDLARLSAIQLLDGYRRRAFTPAEATEAVNAALERIQPTLNVRSPSMKPIRINGERNSPSARGPRWACCKNSMACCWPTMRFEA